MKGFMYLSVSLLLALTACGTLQVSFESTPTPDLAAAGTIAALQARNEQLSTAVAVLNQPTQIPPTPTASPSAAPTDSAPTATRIAFLDGATVGTVSASIQAGQSQNYVLKALQGQPMFVYVGSLNNDVKLSVQRQDGAALLSADAHQASWQGSLPQTEDYFITVHGGNSTESFSLTVTLPARIQFAEGADSATLSGKTVGGYGVSYAVYAHKGQTMNVDLGDLSGKASLSIYGFVDGQAYVRSAKGLTSYHFVLPSTQDYIVVVVPANGGVVSYSMTVRIQ
jgi:hypothetical protein